MIILWFIISRGSNEGHNEKRVLYYSDIYTRLKKMLFHCMSFNVNENNLTVHDTLKETMNYINTLMCAISDRKTGIFCYTRVASYRIH